MSPLNQYSSPLIGFSLTSEPHLRTCLLELVNTSASDPPSATVRESMSMTGIFDFKQLPSGERGMMAFATVFENDPTAYVVGAITTFDQVMTRV